MRLTTDRLILRDIEAKDAKSLVKHINNLEISKWLLSVPYPYTMKDAKWWINHCKKNAKKRPRDSYNLHIELKEKPGIIGGIGFSEVNRKLKIASMGYWLSEDYWRQGLMREAANRLTDYGFNTLKLRKVSVQVFARNIPSANLAKRLGGVYVEDKGPIVCKATGKKHMEKVHIVTPSSWRKSLK